jgi:hypothetical protein
MQAPVSVLIQRALDLLIFRNGPQALPPHNALLGISLLFNVIAAGLAQLASPVPQFGVRAALYIAWTVGLAALLLKLKGALERWQQTATALLWTDAVITLFALPILAYDARLARDGESAGPDAALMLLVLLVWSSAINANLYRHALEIRWPSALAIGFGASIAWIALISVVFGDSA